jgi:pectate lyase
MKNPIFLKTAIAAALFFSFGAEAALPVIPGGAGFGIETPAGRGGKIFRVTSLAASGSGTLAECIAATGPRVCIFETSGVIQLADDLKIRNPYVTIAGQTAPAPGIMIRGGALGIHASDVLVQHLTVRVGDDPTGPLLSNRDAMKITASGNIRNVVIDHCSFSWAVDEVMSMQGDWDNITLSNNIFAEPLANSLHPEGAHGFTSLAGPSAGKLTMVGNLFANGTARNPLSRAGVLAFVNNVVYNHVNQGVDLQGEGFASLNSVVGNVFIKGPNSGAKTPSVRIAGGTLSLLPGSKLYVRDNVGDGADGAIVGSDPWSIVRNDGSLSRSSLEAASAPNWPTGLVAASASNADALNRVLSKAGARPAERSAVDSRIVNGVRNQTGQVINCVGNDGSDRCAKNGGGWPTYAKNIAALSIPSDPSGDADGDGYTNLEEWLHLRAAAVEGDTVDHKPNPPVLIVE